MGLPARRNELSPHRLIDAAEACVRAWMETHARTGGPYSYPADLYGTPLQPIYLDAFTREEVEEASRFLVRLGVIDRPTNQDNTR